MPAYRKQFELTKPEIDAVNQLAAMIGTSASAIGRAWIEEFLKNGSEYTAPEGARLQIVIPHELAAAAEEKARAEYGVPLRDIIRFEINELSKL